MNYLKRYYWLLSLLILALPSAIFAQVPNETDVSNELDQFRLAMTDFFQKRDVEGMLALTHPDVIVTWQNAEVSKGKEEVRKFLDRMLTGPTSVVVELKGKPVVEGRKVYGDHVISYGQLNDVYTLRGDSEPKPFSSRFSALLIKENGKFFLAGIHFSVNAFNNAIMSGAVSKLKRFIILGGIGGIFFGGLISWIWCRRCASMR